MTPCGTRLVWHEEQQRRRKVVRDFVEETALELVALEQQIADDKLRRMEERAEKELAILEKRYEDENAIIQAGLQAGIISQEDAARAEEAAKKRKADKENAIGRKLFEEKKKIEIKQLIIDGLVKAATAFSTTFTAFSYLPPPVANALAAASSAIVLASSGVAVKSAKQKQYTPVVYEDGGIVNGPSHAQGGVPFTVNGYGGYEMEGGEYIVNKRAAKQNFALLEAINGKVSSKKSYFATGGEVSPVFQESALNRAILDALNRPVRAYVTNQDLAYSESERRALEAKTSY